MNAIKNDGEYETRSGGNTNADKKIKRSKKDRLDRGKKFSTYGRRCKAERIQMKRLNRIIDLDEKKERRRYRLNCKYDNDMLKMQNENHNKFEENNLSAKNKLIKLNKKRVKMEKIETKLNKFTELRKKPIKEYLDYKPDNDLYVEVITPNGERRIRSCEVQSKKILKSR